MKKLKFILALWDGIWSIPLSIFVFFVIGVVGQTIFGQVVGFYDPSIWQTVFLAIGILIAFNFAIWFMMWFNFRGVFRYFVGTKDASGKVVNKSKGDSDTITPWQRLKMCLLVYLSFLVALVAILRIVIS